MRSRRIVKVVDALRTQDRLIVHLDCKHNASVWAVQVAANSTGVAGYTCGNEFICDVCPDPLQQTAAEMRQAKSANQLWREAGQP